MNRAFTRLRYVAVLASLCVCGCVEIDVIEPEEGQQVEAQAGQTVTVAVRVRIDNKMIPGLNGDANATIAFSMDGEGYWDNVFFQETYGPGVYIAEATYDIQVTDPPETHWLNVFRVDSIYLDQVPIHIVPPSE
ncbi:MAG: hypothetical protein JXQ73_30135 [Phycisphaerae bacterium]|nr:hypothetical protein [Phycisphaerae bacterium]